MSAQMTFCPSWPPGDRAVVSAPRTSPVTGSSARMTCWQCSPVGGLVGRHLDADTIKNTFFATIQLREFTPCCTGVSGNSRVVRVVAARGTVLEHSGRRPPRGNHAQYIVDIYRPYAVGLSLECRLDLCPVSIVVVVRPTDDHGACAVGFSGRSTRG